MAEQSEQRDWEGLTIPHHVAIIMDGNGRWAQKRGMPRQAGHRAGAEALREVLEACGEFGIKELTVYAFSTENWRRPAEEVNSIMMLVDYFIKRELDHLHRSNVRIRHIGREEGIEASRLKKIREAEERTRNNDRLTLNAAFNYGGRAELVDAVRACVREGLPPEAITEEVLTRHLYTYPSPDPDMIIRTGGEYRLSNFLIWQASYSEIISTDVFWPDFGRSDLLEAIRVFNERERRYGGLPAPQS